MPTEIYTEVKINDRVFSIKKFDAKSGLKLARLLISKAAPIIPLIEEMNGKDGDDRVYEVIGNILSQLDDADIDSIVDKSLRVCYEQLPAGRQPVIDENGFYGVEDVEYDMALTLRLCIEAIKWGAADFFGGSRSTLSQIIRPVG